MSSPSARAGDLLEFNARRRLFILPQWRLAYVSVPKNACTSLKWLVAELAGEDLDALRTGGLGYSATRAGQIHDRKQWQRAPRVKDVDPEVRREISPENGWFVFGVVRDPRVRMFSAWQDKYLLRSPGYWQSWEDGQGPPVPRTPEDIIGSFRDFVLAIAEGRDTEAMQDGHFLTQVHLLNEHLVPFSRLYDMSELGLLTDHLDEHLRANGHDGDLTLARSNKSPFAPCGPVFAGGVREAIESIYAEDFARFGDRWDFSATAAKDVPWGASDFSHAHSIISVNERVADLVRAARAERREKERLEQQVAELREQLGNLDRPEEAGGRTRLGRLGERLSR
jgi:hypothetical protein